MYNNFKFVYMSQRKKNRKSFYICSIPKRDADQVSNSGSQYWYGEDKKGHYTIRFSDHFGYLANSFWDIPEHFKKKEFEEGHRFWRIAQWISVKYYIFHFEL